VLERRGYAYQRETADMNVGVEIQLGRAPEAFPDEYDRPQIGDALGSLENHARIAGGVDDRREPAERRCGAAAPEQFPHLQRDQAASGDLDTVGSEALDRSYRRLRNGQ
jgi:hypothetical protein